MELLINKIKEHYEDELADAESYCDLSKKFNDERHHKIEKILKDISYEESIHAKLLNEILEEYDIVHPQNKRTEHEEKDNTTL